MDNGQNINLMFNQGFEGIHGHGLAQCITFTRFKDDLDFSCWQDCCSTDTWVSEDELYAAHFMG